MKSLISFSVIAAILLLAAGASGTNQVLAFEHGGHEHGGEFHGDHGWGHHGGFGGWGHHGWSNGGNEWNWNNGGVNGNGGVIYIPDHNSGGNGEINIGGNSVLVSNPIYQAGLAAGLASCQSDTQ